MKPSQLWVKPLKYKQQLVREKFGNYSDEPIVSLPLFKSRMSQIILSHSTGDISVTSWFLQKKMPNFCEKSALNAAQPCFGS